MTTTTRLLTVAGEHHWVLSAAELHDLGLTRSAIRHRVRTGLLHPKHPGVFAVGRPALAPEGRWRAGTLVEPGAVLCGLSAAALWAILPARPGPVHIAIPEQTGRSRQDGLVRHRCDRLLPSDVTVRRGILVTTLGRTLRDLAGVLDAKGLDRAIRQADRLHQVDLVRLHKQMGPPRPGANLENRLRKALEAYVAAEVNEGLEEAGQALVTRFELPTPAYQHAIGPYFADLAWEDVRLVVELDDRASHATWTQMQHDRARDRYMAAHGWEVMRFTWADLTRRPAEAAAEIRAALIRRRVVVAATTTTRL